MFDNDITEVIAGAAAQALVVGVFLMGAVGVIAAVGTFAVEVIRIIFPGVSL